LHHFYYGWVIVVSTEESADCQQFIQDRPKEGESLFMGDHTELAINGQ
jgi:hypothetical protein